MAPPMKVLYIHGFNSAGYGDKCNALRAEFGTGNVVNPTLPYAPAAAMEVLDWLVSRLNDEHFFILGSSLGGFYALNLALRYPVKTVLVNPALMQVSTGLAYAKEIQHNCRTDEDFSFSEADIAALDALEIQDWSAFKGPVRAYIDADDELLPAHKHADFLQTQGIPVTLFEGGDHRFQHIAETLTDVRQHFVPVLA